MNETDLKAIATYLKSIPGRNDDLKPIAADNPQMKAGGAIYRDQCSACHGLDGKGVADLFPSLAEFVTGPFGRPDNNFSDHPTRCAQRRDLKKSRPRPACLRSPGN